MQPANQSSRNLTSHFFIPWSFQQPYSSKLCTHRLAVQSPKHPIIHPFTKLSTQSVIHPTGIKLSINLTTNSSIHPFIHRAIISPIDISNHPYISNLCIHRPSFQPSMHLIIQLSTKLPVESIIRPSGISLFIPITTQSSIYQIIPWAIILSIGPSNQTYSSNLCTHRPSFQPAKDPIIRSSTKLSVQSLILPSDINLSIHLNNQPATLHSFIQKIFVDSTIHSCNQPYIRLICCSRLSVRQKKRSV